MWVLPFFLKKVIVDVRKFIDMDTEMTSKSLHICSTCTAQFIITAEEKAFYDKISPLFNGITCIVPVPNECPDCRQKKRLRFRNGLNLYGRSCDLCKKDIISVYPQDTISPVYCPQCWWGDGWWAESFKLAISSQSPFANIRTLLTRVPVLSLININSENSTYAHDAENNKNCYLVFSTIESVDSMYIVDSNRMRNSLDCYWSANCELCYELINCSESYQSAYSSHSYQLSFSYFCENCISCSNCFGCFNLANKQYYIFNKSYSKEDYEAKIAEFTKRMQTWAGCEEVKKEIGQFFSTQPHKYATVVHCESCTGDFLVNTKDCFECYNVINSQDCGYLYDCVSMKDSYDCNLSGRSELMYNCQSCSGQNNISSSFSSDCSNLMYSDHCFNCHNCFGCVGLRKKEYCIFNQQYSKAEYEQFVPQLIRGLIAENQWGKFFPQELAPIHLSDSVLTSIFPEDRHQTVEVLLTRSNDTSSNAQLPKVNCRSCHKDFLILKQELAFYESNKLPLPVICFSCRQQRRIEKRNSRKLKQRNCDKCAQQMWSSYLPGDKTIVYCHACYQEAGV